METPFPHLTSTGPPPSHRLVTSTYRDSFNTLVQEGRLRPFVLPYHLYGCILLLLYLCIPHTQSPWIYAARWPVLAIILAFQWKTLWEVTSMSMAIGYAAGLIAVWGAVWSLTWLVLYKPQFDARRVERRVRPGTPAGTSGGKDSNGHASGSNGTTTGHTDGSAELEYRGQKDRKTNEKLEKDTTEWEYYWQPYPDNFLDRFNWTSDLLMNFRGPGWNWAIPPLPLLPPSIQTQLDGENPSRSKSGTSQIGLKRYDTRADLARAHLPRFIAGYLLLDILKVVMMKDPYFTFGPTSYSLPPYLSTFQNSPTTLRLIRQAITTLSILVSLEMTFLLAPLTISLLIGPSLLGLRAEPYYYPTTWGSFSNVTSKGLNGLWGGWWHQIFRFIFAAPTNYLIRNGYVEARSPTAKILALGFAFGISGLLHAGGSVSQFPKTHPSHAPIFFMLQALGIGIQMSVCSLAHTRIKNFPKAVRQAGNFTFVFAWLFCTGSWLTDDFARGGIWLYEPIPISFLRGMGFGDEGDGWWCWENIGIGWYSGRRWWESGIAL